MSKTVTTNVRNDDAMGMIHLFEFDMYLLDGNFSETLRFTDKFWSLKRRFYNGQWFY